MTSAKKPKLDNTLDNCYEYDFEYRTFKVIGLAENNVKVLETVNYQWKVQYKIVRKEDSKKLEVSVDFDSRYVFDDKVTMHIIVEAAGTKIKRKFELEKKSGQKFYVNLDQIGSEFDDKDIKVTCDIGVSCAEYNAEYRGTEALFTQDDRPHDTILLVGEEKFYVLRQYLATWSKYFNTLFFGKSAEKDKREFEIKDVDANQFKQLLHFIYPALLNGINERNVLYLLKLAARFEMPSVIAMCGTYLSDFVNLPSLSVMERLELSDKHNISHLQIAVLKKIHIKRGNDLKAFLDENRNRIKNMSEGTVKNLI